MTCSRWARHLDPGGQMSRRRLHGPDPQGSATTSDATRGKRAAVIAVPGMTPTRLHLLGTGAARRMRALSYAPAGVGKQLGSLSRLRMGAQNARIWTASALIQLRPMSTQNGGYRVGAYAGAVADCDQRPSGSCRSSGLLGCQPDSERDKDGAGHRVQGAAYRRAAEQVTHLGEGHRVAGQPEEGHRAEHQSE